MARKIKARYSQGKIEPLEPLSLKEGQEIVISVEEAPTPEKKPGRRTRTFSAKDSLWNLAGIGQGDEATDVSQNIHKYIADAYEHKGR